MKKALSAAFPLTLPVMAGYVFLGIAFGFLMQNKGFPTWLPILMSVVIYSGALEFAAINLLTASFDPIGSFVMGLMISARHLFYGIPMLKKYADTGKFKLFLIFGLTDETFSISSITPVPDGADRKSFYGAISLLNYSYWVGGTAIGALFGKLITIDTTGIDFALTALFIVLFIEQLKNRDGVISGSIGLLSSVAVLLIFGSERMVVFSMIAILVLLLCGKRVISRD